mmetsp:Transcript_33968/g.57658  ORF Transcript_33968/g.57658 Transcript_33968/m.57658 type:complete len:85 (-) Transcript_33968:355-609(-)
MTQAAERSSSGFDFALAHYYLETLLILALLHDLAETQAVGPLEAAQFEGGQSHSVEELRSSTIGPKRALSYWLSNYYKNLQVCG